MKGDWGFSAPNEIDVKALNKSIKAYNRPIDSHDCGKCGCNKAGSDAHDYEEIWDDFELSPRQREVIFMESIRARGRYNREMILIRMFKSTRDGSYILRLQTATELTVERMGDINFDTHEECIEYYNYCIGVFKFTEVTPVSLEKDGTGFFNALSDVEEEFSWGLDLYEDDDDDDEEDDEFENFDWGLDE